LEKLHNEEVHNLYSSPNVVSDNIKEDEMARTCSSHGGDEIWILTFGRET